MNKKLLMTLTSVGVGVVMLAGTAFASVRQTTGYEAYKLAVKKTIESKSFTGKFEASLKDNDVALAEFDSIIKLNDSTEKLSGKIIIKANGQEKALDTFIQDDKVIFKVNEDEEDNYYVAKEDGLEKNVEKEFESEEYDSEAAKVGEMIIDYLAGNMKNYFEVEENADGSKEISFQLSGSQIPSVVNAVASLGIKDAAKDNTEDKSRESLPFGKDIKVNFPKLTRDIRIDNVNIKADVNENNVIESQIAGITILGKDAGGKEHKVVISMDMSLYDIGNTTPDTINLEGKNVKELKPEDFKDRDCQE